MPYYPFSVYSYVMATLACERRQLFYSCFLAGKQKPKKVSALAGYGCPVSSQKYVASLFLFMGLFGWLWNDYNNSSIKSPGGLIYFKPIREGVVGAYLI